MLTGNVLAPAQGHEGDRSPLHNNGSVLPDMDDEIEGDEDLAPVEKGGVDELEEDELGDEMEGVEDELDEGFDTVWHPHVVGVSQADTSQRKSRIGR